MSNVLELRNVSKKYGDKLAVSDLSFSIKAGEIFGLIGPNGAGKTSVIRMINQIFLPDSGDILIEGKNLSQNDLAKFGYMPEEKGLYPKMKVGEQIMYLAQLRGLSHGEAKKRTKMWLEKFGLMDVAKKKASDLSKGMQQKVQFIITVIHEPKILILDEPLSGLDPINANLLNDKILSLKVAGTTIIFSTHRMEQVEQICDRVLILNNGKHILEGGVNELKQMFKANVFQVEFTGNASAKILNSNYSLLKTEANNLYFSLNIGQNSTQLLKYLLDNNLQITRFNEVLPTLNEIFIKEVTKQN